ncbi:MAG: PEP-CTERM sorting domain-containing protein [Parvularculaceae bacterium]
MTMATRIIIVLLAACVAALPAKASTSFFGASVFSETGVTDANLAIGAADGAGATIAAGGELVLDFGVPLTGEAVSLFALPTDGFSFLSVSLGEVVGGVATFFPGSPLVGLNAGGVLTTDVASSCSFAPGSSCSLIRIQNLFSTGGEGFVVDAVSAVSTVPEPGAWALMLLGFAGVAWRVKAARSTGVDLAFA